MSNSFHTLPIVSQPGRAEIEGAWPLVGDISGGGVRKSLIGMDPKFLFFKLMGTT